MKFAIPHAVFVAMLATSPGARGAGTPQIACDEPTYDFGMVDDAPFVEHTYVLRNDGDADLAITRVRPSCGCTTAGLSAETIHPGETAELTARLNLKGRHGTQRKSITIESNDPASPHFRLELNGTIQRTVDFQPTRFLLQISETEREATGSVRVTFNTAEPHSLTELSATPTNLFVVESTAVQPGHTFDIVLRSLAGVDLSEPYRTGQVTVRTDHADYATLTIPVVLNVVRDVVVAPTQLRVDTNVNSRLTQQILVRNRRPDAIELLDATSGSEGVTVTPRKVNATMYQLEVVIENPAATRDGDAITISVKRGENEPEEYIVPILPRNP